MNFKRYIEASDTWVDSHYIKKTDTDIITTLPATIYPLAQTATLGLKGNTVQNGTPTPDNPIMPQGCGDLETVGAKAGQYKIPISSASTITPVYLGEVETTRKIKKLVLSSSQNWKLQSINSHGIANFYVIITNDFLNISSLISNYFTRQITPIADTTTEGILISLSGNSATVYIRINSQTASTAQEFKDWLDSLSEEAAIWYVLANETTGIVNEPLRKIGDYADEVSDISIPTTAGANTLSIGTTVQPSEVTVNYKGWHPVADVHKRENGAWD